MDGIVLFKKGLRDFVKKELSDYDFTNGTDYLVLEDINESVVNELLYSARIYERVGVLIDDFSRLKKFSSFNYEGPKSLKKRLEDEGLILEALNPDVFLREHNGLIFVDRTPERDLAKRGYEIKKPMVSSDIVSAMIDWSSWNEKKSLLDPFCENSNVCIEAAMKSLSIPTGFTRSRELGVKKDYEINDKKLKIFCYSSNIKHINFMRKQAVLARVNDYLTYSRQLLKYIDFKLGKNNIDNLITSFFNAGEDVFEEFFFQFEHIVKEDGQIVVCTDNEKQLIEWGELYDFKIVDKLLAGDKELFKLESTKS